MIKLALIISESPIYLDKQVDNIIEKFALKKTESTLVTQFAKGLTTAISMFGTPFVILDLSDKTDLKKFVELIDSKKKNKLFDDEFWGNGLIIKTTHTQGTTKIQKLVENCGGEVIKQDKPTDLLKSIMDKYSINKHTQSDLKDYIREDLDLMVSLDEYLKTVNEPKELHFEQIIMSLPSKQGAIPVWEFVERMFDSNIEIALSTLERTLEHYHPLVLITLLKNKFNLYYRFLALDTLKIKNADKPKILNCTPYTLYSFQKVKNKNLENASEICFFIHKAEEHLKSGLKYAQREYLENLLIEIMLLMRG